MGDINHSKEVNALVRLKSELGISKCGQNLFSSFENGIEALSDLNATIINFYMVGLE